MLGLSKLYLKSMNHLISLLFSLPRENKRLITVTVFLLWEPFCIPSYQVKWQWDAKWHNDFTLLQNSSSTVCLGPTPHAPPRHFHCAIFLTMASFAEGIWHGVSGHSSPPPHFLFNNVKQEFCLCPKQTELQIMCWIFSMFVSLSRHRLHVFGCCLCFSVCRLLFLL